MNAHISWFTQSLKNQELIASLNKIKLIVCDVDGTLTNGQVFFPEDSDEIKGFSTLDGFGIAQAIKRGLHVAFLSGRASKTVAQRAHKLGVPPELCALGIDHNKIDLVRKMQEYAGATTQETMIIGDDMLDFEAREACALFAAPSNTPFYIQSAAHILIPAFAGQGAVRLMIDLLLYCQEKHFAQHAIQEALNTG